MMPKEPENNIQINTGDFNIGPEEVKSFHDTILIICDRFKLKNADISIAIVDDERIKRINTDFLEHNYTTDVISFDLSDDTDNICFEIVVNYDQARRQAQKRDHGIFAELALYIVHGMLHNLGFDDAELHQSRIMHNTEDEILQQAGFGIIYEK